MKASSIRWCDLKPGDVMLAEGSEPDFFVAWAVVGEEEGYHLMLNLVYDGIVSRTPSKHTNLVSDFDYTTVLRAEEGT